MTRRRKKNIFDDGKTPAYMYIIIAAVMMALLAFIIVFGGKGDGRFSRFYPNPTPTASQSDSTD